MSIPAKSILAARVSDHGSKLSHLVFFTLVLTLLLAGTVFCQTPGPIPGPTPEPTEPDLINADRPGIADGSGVVGPKTFQLETGIQLEFRPCGETSEHTFFIPTLLRIGIGNHWEARIEGNTFTRDTTFTSGNVSERASGLAPTSLGFKYHISNFGDAQQLSLGAIVRVFPSWGSHEFRTQHTTGDVRLAADWNFAPQLKLSLNPNVGVARYEDDLGRLFTAGLFAATLNYQPTKKLNPFIDVGVQSPEVTEGKSSAILDGGVAYILGRNVQFDASVGTRVHGVTGPRPFLEFGISWRTRPFHHDHHQ